MRRALADRRVPGRRPPGGGRVAVAEGTPERAVPAVQGPRDEQVLHAVAVGHLPALRRDEAREEVAIMRCKRCGAWIWGSISKHKCGR